MSEKDLLSKTIVNNLSVSVLYDAKSRCSFCWKYFGNLVLHDKNKRRIICTDYVYCSVCLNTVKAESGNITFATAKVKVYNKRVSTGNLTRHLSGHHLIKDNNVSTKRKKDSKDTTRAPIHDTWVVAKDMVVWFCKSLMPLDSVCDEGMEDFFRKYNMIIDKDDLPTNENVSQSALDYVYERMLNNVIEQIFHDAAPNLALSFDSWTDHYRRLNYITVTLHYVTSEFKLKKFNLSTRLIDQNQSPEKIVVTINQVLKQFGLSDRKMYAVTNNENVASATLMAGLKQHLCLSHGLHNLIIVDGIKAIPEADNLVKKCKIIIETLHYRMAELADEGALPSDLISSFDNVMETLQCDENDPFPVDPTETAIFQNDTFKLVPANILFQKDGIPTRWHCLLEMLEVFVKVFSQHHVNNILKHLAQEELSLTEVEWKLLEELVNFLGKFRDVVSIISSEKNCTIHVALVFRAKVVEVLNELSDDESIVMLRLKRNMLSNIYKRFPTTSIIFTTALLDYRFMELKQVDIYLETIIYSTKASHLADFIKENNFNITQVNQSSMLHKLSIKHGIPDDEGQKKVEDDLIDKECTKYIASSDLSAPTDENPLVYWRGKKKVYPTLSTLARALLCIPALNVSSERAFNVDGINMSFMRSRLHPAKLNKIMFIHDNHKICT